MDNLEVRKYLPHRFPFLLLDKVIEVSAPQSLVAIKNVTANEPFFVGHFPIAPIMPGVLIIEALAQAAGILTFKSIGRYPTPEELYYLAGVDNARFKRMVVPGDQLRLEVTFEKQRMDLWKFKGVASVNGDLACSADIMTIRGSE